ncbi:fibropellin-1-like [Ylistrum balloti]|uniref:fibropellin-1-like n=1 Tax=Ylistrum balloti TaxID=509963 RepID=UPI002905F711|nr:fibropellin-1-like [Ylistrum balloti]
MYAFDKTPEKLMQFDKIFRPRGGLLEIERELENVIEDFLKEKSSDSQKRTDLNKDVSYDKDVGIKQIIDKMAEKKSKHQQRRTNLKVEMNAEDLNKLKSETVCENNKCHKARGDGFDPIPETHDGHKTQKLKTTGGRKRYIDTSGNGLWPKGVVPYDTNSLMSYFQSSSNPSITQSGIPGFILDSVELFKEKTCLEWRPKTEQDGSEYVEITGDNTKGCYAGVGKYSGIPTPIHFNLDVSAGCNAMFVVLHEFLHAIDGTHEQQRRDRMEALTINWDALQADAAGNYITEPDDVFTSSSSVPFSLASVLMYSRFIFTKTNGQETMNIKNKDLEFLTEDTKNVFSFYDLEAITNVYQCGSDCTSTVCQNGGFATKTINNPVCTCVCPEHLSGSTCEGLTGSGTCSGTVILGESGSQLIQSLNYPNTYSKGLKCVYLIKASAGSRIKFELNDMDIAEESSTCMDTLEIRYNLIGEPGPEFCGTTTVTKTMLSGVNSESHIATVIWDTTSGKSTTAGNGFSLRVTAFKSGCLNRPCKNGGTCTEDMSQAGAFVCACPTGIGGTDCSLATGAVSCNEGTDIDIDGPCFLKNQGGTSMQFGETILSGKSTDPPKPADGLTFYQVQPTGSYLTTDAATLVSDVTFPDDVALCVRFKTIVNNDQNSATQLSLQVSDDANSSPRDILTITNTGLNAWVSKEHEITASSSSTNRKVYFRGVYGAGFGLYLDDISVFPGKCDLCSPNPCQNGGTCSQTGNSMSCACKTGFKGETCEAIVECLTDTCSNGGTCTNTNGVLSCNCVTGFTGKTCEIEDLCAPVNPCSNGGTCSMNGDTFTCKCAAGFWGTTCNAQDVCSSSSTCQNGATCIQTGNTNFYCNCPAGFYGTSCHQTDVCTTNPCQNSGSCQSVGQSDFYCVCATNFIGDSCSDSGTGCSFETGQTCPFEAKSYGQFNWVVSSSATGLSKPQHGQNYMVISNNGRQVNDQAWLYASSGLPAEEYCLTFYYVMSGAPGNFGVYSTTSSGYTLYSRWIRSGESFTEYKLAKTDVPTGHTQIAFLTSLSVVDTNAYVAIDNIRAYSGACDNCKPNPCENGGTCGETNGAATCSCVSGYTGATCSDVTYICINNPCQNGGTCSGTADSFTCSCAAGFEGLTCETSLTGPCATSPCKNGGVCSSSGSTYSCTCTGGYTGATCETINACATNPCQNSGTCTASGSSYTCQCATGFSGNNCDVASPCATNPCQNGGTCTASGSSYTCQCTTGFIGNSCDVTSPCATNPCQNSGTCTASGSSYTCQCATGFSGNNCDINKAADIMTCSFEVGESNCGLTQGTNNIDDYFDWTVNSGSTPTSGTGPSGAFDGNRYMFIEVNGKESNTYAILKGENLPAQDKCMMFNYHMKRNTYALQVYGYSPGPFTNLWEQYGSHGDDWKSASITVSSSSTSIYIAGWKGSSNKGDIAIDNIRIKSGACWRHQQPGFCDDGCLGRHQQLGPCDDGCLGRHKQPGFYDDGCLGRHQQPGSCDDGCLGRHQHPGFYGYGYLGRHQHPESYDDGCLGRHYKPGSCDDWCLGRHP